MTYKSKLKFESVQEGMEMLDVAYPMHTLTFVKAYEYNVLFAIIHRNVLVGFITLHNFGDDNKMLMEVEEV